VDDMPTDDVNLFVRGYMTARETFYRKGGGVGWYNTFTHVDIRDGEHLNFWGK